MEVTELPKKGKGRECRDDGSFLARLGVGGVARIEGGGGGGVASSSPEIRHCLTSFCENFTYDRDKK